MLVPCSFAFAFALVLIRTKPAGIPIKDYVLALRKSSSFTQHSPKLVLINHAKVWEHLFRQVQQSYLAFHDARPNSHYEKAGHAEAAEYMQPYVGEKRKPQVEATETLETNSQCKRRKLSQPTHTASGTHSTPHEEQHQDLALLLQSKCQLIQMAQAPLSNRSSLTYAISTACDAILQAGKTTRSTETSDTSCRSQASSMGEACQAATQIWSSIISNLNLQHSDSGSALKSEPIAISMSAVLRFFLDYLRQQCHEEVEQKIDDLPRIRNQNDTGGKSSSKAVQGVQRLSQNDSDAVTSGLLSMVRMLDKLQEKHQGLFDAIVSVLLQHVGESMALHLWGLLGHDFTTNHAIPGGLIEVKRNGVWDAISAAKIEAPFLVQLLKGLLQTNGPKNMIQTNTAVLEALQTSLLQGVFGDDDEVPWYEACSNAVPHLRTIEKADPDAELYYEDRDDDWFLTQVWELLGWDIMLG